MRVFDKFNSNGDSVCPVCKTAEEKQTILIAMDGTEDDGVMEAKQYHLDCVELRQKDMGDESTILYMMVKS